MKVLHGPVNVGNHPWVLSRQERTLGVGSDLVVNYGTWFNYPADRYLGSYGKKTPAALARRCVFSLTAPLRYDVLHLYFGRSFLSWEDYGAPRFWEFWDLKLAKKLGRKVFMTLQGCDIRLSDQSAVRDLNTPCQLGNCEDAPNCRASADARRRRLIANILPLFHRVFVLNPELAQFVPGAVFLPYANVDVEPVEPCWPKREGPITILHAPTNEGVKGTRFVLAALESLKKRWDLEILLVKNVPHAEALGLYRRADLVIDQLLAGWYGGFAVEVMAMGKPVGCYLREADFDCLPPAMRRELPLLRLSPQTIEADLEAALQRRHEWPDWGRRCREFVLRWHHPRRIAAAMVRAYRDPESTFCLPSN